MPSSVVIHPLAPSNAFETSPREPRHQVRTERLSPIQVGAVDKAPTRFDSCGA